MGYGNYSTLALNLKHQQSNSKHPSLVEREIFFDFFNCIGKGATSKVWKVKYKPNRQYYALKQMSKRILSDKQAIELAFNERDILLPLNNGFIGNLYCSFQDKENLYLLFDLIGGGDLRYHLSNDRLFNEDQIKFFAACIIQGIEYMHSKGIVHRDIKPENLICDDRGYIRITDFGISKRLGIAETSPMEVNGTYGYIAPELVLSRSSSFDADYFALGVVLYELCTGERPFKAKNKYDMLNEYKTKTITMTIDDLPNRLPRNEDLCDFINCLLTINPNDRLGHNGVNELKRHKFFSKFNWNELALKDMISPFIPKPSDLYTNTNDNKDTPDHKDKEKDKENNQQQDQRLSEEEFQKQFEHFSNFDYIKKAKSLKFNLSNISIFKRTSFVHLRRETSNFSKQANATVKNFFLLKQAQTPMKLKLMNSNFKSKVNSNESPSAFLISSNKRINKHFADSSNEFPNINKMKCVSPNEWKVSLTRDRDSLSLSKLTKKLFQSKVLKHNSSLSYLKS